MNLEAKLTSTFRDTFLTEQSTMLLEFICVRDFKELNCAIMRREKHDSRRLFEYVFERIIATGKRMKPPRYDTFCLMKRFCLSIAFAGVREFAWKYFQTLSNANHFKWRIVLNDTLQVKFYISADLNPDSFQVLNNQSFANKILYFYWSESSIYNI